MVKPKVSLFFGPKPEGSEKDRSRLLSLAAFEN